MRVSPSTALTFLRGLPIVFFPFAPHTKVSMWQIYRSLAGVFLFTRAGPVFDYYIYAMVLIKVSIHDTEHCQTLLPILHAIG